MDEPCPGVVAIRENQIHVLEKEPGERIVSAPRFDAVEKQHDLWGRMVEHRQKLQQVKMPYKRDFGLPSIPECLQDSLRFGRS